ncbi:MAG: serine hydrolase, partial [Pseudomonadota bacterium]
MDQQTIDVISAFQMHFLPWRVNGRNDESTTAAIFALIDKYFPDRLDALLQRYDNEANLLQKPVFVTNGQVDKWFNANDNNASFYAYASAGEITITASQSTHADIYINGEKLLLKDPFTQSPVTYSLRKRTRHGLNSFEIDDFSSNDASVLIQLSYPVISSRQRANGTNTFTRTSSLISTKLQETSGAAELLVVQKGNVVHHQTFGAIPQVLFHNNDASSESIESNAESHQFGLNGKLNSISTTLAIMHMVTQGRVILSKPVYTYLPEYRGMGRDLITVEDLLIHTTGYKRQLTDYLDFETKELNRMLSDSAFVNDLIMTKLPVAKGLSASFSEINQLLLAQLIARLNGMTVDEYVTTFVYQPLGLLASFTKNEFEKGNTYGNASHDAYNAYSTPTMLNQLYMRAPDMAVLAQLMLNQGGYGFTSVFDTNTHLRFVSPDAQTNEQALGWQTNAFVNASDALDGLPLFGNKVSKSAFGHMADGQFLLIDPALDLSVILLSEGAFSSKSSYDDAIEIIDSIYAEILTKQ